MVHVRVGKQHRLRNESLLLKHAVDDREVVPGVENQGVAGGGVPHDVAVFLKGTDDNGGEF